MISHCRFALIAAATCTSLIVKGYGAAPEVTLPHQTNEVWIASRTDDRSGTGTESDPYDGSTPSRFDAVIAGIPANTTIHFLPGTFVTKGIIPKSGWRFYLSDKTTLRLDVLSWIPGQKWAIFGAGSPKPVSHVWIEGGIWDCNLQSQRIPLAAQAISFISSEGDITIKNIKVVNWGSTFKGAECFVVSVFNVGSKGKIAENVVLDGIEMTQPAPITHHSSATLIGAHGEDPVDPRALSNGWIENVEIKNCYIHDFDLPVMTASVGMGSWCHGVHIYHNRFENLGPKNNTLFGCYLDTGASEDLLIEENVFSGVVHSIFANVTTPDPITNWVIRNNRIAINRSSSSGGIELRGSNTTIRNVLIEQNAISSANGKGLSAWGILLSNVNGAVLQQNVIDDLTESRHIVFEKGVTEAQCLDNRMRNGKIVGARSPLQLPTVLH